MVYMSKYLSTIYKDFYKKVVDSTTDIIPNLQSTKSQPWSWSNSTPFISKKHCSSSNTGEVTESLRNSLRGKLSKCNFQHER